jgi:hypothetical protein
MSKQTDYHHRFLISPLQSSDNTSKDHTQTGTSETALEALRTTS